jgi:hypothetical protein
MIKLYPIRFILILLVSLIVGCGAGGGGGLIASATSGSGGGIGGTGLTSSGTIDGFGSIFVNGVEFETDGAEIVIDGQQVTADELALGMVVLVAGRVNDDGVTGVASQVIFDSEVQGPITSIKPGRDGDSLLLVAAGVEVIAEQTGTVFSGLGFDSIAVGDYVQVSGFPEGPDRLRATRIAKKTPASGNVDDVEIEGVITGLTAGEFTLRGLVVDYSAADVTGLPGGAPAVGMTVQVRGVIDPVANKILADRVTPEDTIVDQLGDAAEVSVQGAITSFASIADFRINGVRVDATDATLRPSGLMPGNDMVVEVEGNWDGTRLRARKLEARRGRVEIESTVAAVDSAAGSLTMQFEGARIVVKVDSRTMFDDNHDDAGPLTLAAIRSGEFLRIEAIQGDDALVATRVDRENIDDSFLQARIESFSAGASITLLGVTFSTRGTGFETEDDISVTSDQFYGALQSGQLVKVRDNYPPDGIADEVEIELENVLDGAREFDEDDASDRESEDDDIDSEDHPGDTDEVEEKDELDAVDAPDEVDEVDEVDDVEARDEIDDPDEPDELDEPDQPE